ncbi:MAG: DNA-directed RNA polymerase subunit L [Candidatus Nitrosomirales archaeon]|jgi:DNA-directed RNA polymerase subunit L
MEASVVDFKDNEVNLSVKEEDIAIMYIVQHELLSNKKVDFAGVALKHPLTGEYDVRIVTESGNPLDALVESTKSAREYIESLSQLVKSKVKG